MFNFQFYAADEVVVYKHGERSADALKANGFSNVLFKSYNRFDTSPIQLHLAYISIFNFSLIMMITLHLEVLGTTLSQRRWTKSANGSKQIWSLGLHHLDWKMLRKTLR